MKTKWNKKRIIAAGVGTFLLASLLTLQFIPQQYVYRVMKHYDLLVPSAHGTDITDLVGLTGNVGKEDVEWGSGLDTDTFDVPSSTSGTVTLTKLPSLYANIASLIKGRWYVSGDTIANHANAAVEGSLAWIVTQLAGATATIELPPDTYLFTGSYTFPATVALDSQFGSIIQTNGNVVTINGPWICGPWKAFTAAPGEVVLGPTSASQFLPEWWGAIVGDGLDDASALQSAITNSGVSGNLLVMLSTGIYNIETGLSTFKSLNIRGQGRKRSRIETTSEIRMLDIGYLQTTLVNNVQIIGIGFDGNEVATSGVWVDQGSQMEIDDLEVREIAGRGLTLAGQWDSVVSNSQFPQNGVYATSTPAVWLGRSSTGRPTNSIKWVGNCDIERADYTNLVLDSVFGVSFIGLKIHGRAPADAYANSFPLVQVLGSTRITFDSLQMVWGRSHGIYIGENDNGKASDVIISNSTFTSAANYNISPISISAITNANPVQVTTVGNHGLTTGNAVYISGVVGVAPVLPQTINLSTMVNHGPDDIPFVITQTADPTKFTIDGLDLSDTGVYSAYSARGAVINAADTNAVWWIYIENGQAVVSGNDFYYVPQAIKVNFTDSGDTVSAFNENNPHGLEDYQAIVFTSITGTTGISINTTYFVVNSGDDLTFQVAATPGGAALPLTTDGTGYFALSDAMSYTCIGGDVYNSPLNTKSVIYGPSKYNSKAGHTILDTGGGDYTYVKGNWIFKHYSANTVPITIRVEDGLTDGSSATHTTFTIQGSGTQRWHDSTGAVDFLLERKAVNTLSLTGPSDAVDTKLSLDRFHLRALDAEPTTVSVGDIVRANNGTWDPLGITGVEDYLVYCVDVTPNVWLPVSPAYRSGAGDPNRAGCGGGACTVLYLGEEFWDTTGPGVWWKGKARGSTAWLQITP